MPVRLLHPRLPQHGNRGRDYHGAFRDSEAAWDCLRIHFCSGAHGLDPQITMNDLYVGAWPEVTLSVYHDVRLYMQRQHLMDMAGLSGIHDGRHYRAQLYLLDEMVAQWDGTGDPPLDTTWELLFEVLNDAKYAAQRRVDHLFVQLGCRQGRHRSVAHALLLCKIFRAMNLDADAWMYDTAQPGHHTRQCSYRNGVSCVDCVDGASALFASCASCGTLWEAISSVSSVWDTLRSRDSALWRRSMVG